VRPAAAFTTSRAARGAFALAVGALVVLPGCGSSSKGKPIPSAAANQLLARLQVADQDARDQKCAAADSNAHAAQTIVDRLPPTVDPDVRQGLVDGLARLRSLIASQCQPPHTTPTQTTTTQTQTTQSQTTTSQTQTTATDTTPTDTNTQTTPTTTPPTGTGTSTTTTTPGNGGVPPPPAGTGAGGAPGQ
jgi:hypothetical protein